MQILGGIRKFRLSTPNFRWRRNAGRGSHAVLRHTAARVLRSGPGLKKSSRPKLREWILPMWSSFSKQKQKKTMSRVKALNPAYQVVCFISKYGKCLRDTVLFSNLSLWRLHRRRIWNEQVL